MADETDLGVMREPLTPRQRCVLELIGKGYTNHQIAQDLGITLDGAKWHVREILTKLGVENREAAAAWYARRRTPVARLQQALRALIPSATALKFAGGLAGVAVLAILTVAAVVAFRGGDDPATAMPGEPTAAASPGATQPPSGGPAFGGVPVSEWTIAAPQPVPDGLALYIAAGCWACDGPASSLQRVVSLGEGDDSRLETKTLFTAPGDGEPYILSLRPLAGGGSVFATVCSRGYCGGIDDPTNDAQSTLYRSTNGGITWLPLEAYDGRVLITGLTENGVALVAFGRVADDMHFFLYETGQAIGGVDGAAWEPYTIGRQFTLRTGEGALVNGDGEPLFVPPEGWHASLAGQSSPDGDRYAVTLAEPGALAPAGVGLVGDGELLRVFTGQSLAIGGWLSGTLAAGNVFVHPDEIPGVEADPPADSSSIPALFDFEQGTITPLEIDGPLFESDTYFGRNTVLAAAAGAWYTAAGGNECVRLRSGPSLDASTVACYSDGVLMDFSGETAGDAGREWGEFTGPDGHRGWSDLEFVRD